MLRCENQVADVLANLALDMQQLVRQLVEAEAVAGPGRDEVGELRAWLAHGAQEGAHGGKVWQGQGGVQV